MTFPKAILFDLDGTLLDTAQDLAFALNQLRKERGLHEMPFLSLRHIVGLGAKSMLKSAFDIEPTHLDYPLVRERFLTLYSQHIADTTTFFPNMEQVLHQLEIQDIPWGIVTNRHTKYTLDLLSALGFTKKPGCIVCGDTLPTFKPDPAPILYGCELLQQQPADCLYIGDAITDVIASLKAGVRSVVALYGYLSEQDQPYSWNAEAYINDPIEILQWIRGGWKVA